MCPDIELEAKRAAQKQSKYWQIGAVSFTVQTLTGSKGGVPVARWRHDRQHVTSVNPAVKLTSEDIASLGLKKKHTLEI
jgi:hypothetical protein